MVHVISVPRIGGNYRPLEADDNYEKAILDLAPHVSVFVVACTTLHEYADRIEALRLTPQFLSYVEVVERFLVGISPESIVGVIGPQWTAMDDCGIYSPWQQVILAIKQNGPQDPGAIRVYHQMLGEFEAKTIVLACTELPLLPEPDKVDKRVVDVHKLVALEALDALADTGMLSEAAIGST
eukprot:TRINITY_DN2889_c0_g1_i16.p1 TRINITY_DN2889_c0_g1~~TRINITY_DN2889_c0_g1_i16.p1  ORF type:complete len:182 (-),score=45.93 TRINITY_DN2889_c0_g1_i16:20-565(-)